MICVILENILLQGIEESHYNLEKRGMYRNNTDLSPRATDSKFI